MSKHLLILMSILGAFGVATPANAGESLLESIRELDAATAQIGYRLATSNAPLCDRLEPGLGLVLHTPQEYALELREEAIRYFQFKGPVGVEAVIPGSPAALSDIQPDDALFGIGTVQFRTTDLQAKANTDALIQISDDIAALAPDKTVTAFGQRKGQRFVRHIDPVPACRTRFELIASSNFSASADGTMVQISSRFFAEYTPDLVTAAIAHELAHNILNHRERLQERGVSYGLLSGFGRNVRYFRQTELEADILSVSLLANAGYDPAVAVRFWQSFGPRTETVFRSRSHPAWQDRVKLIQQAISNLGNERTHRPAVLEKRSQILDGEWQSLLKMVKED